MQTGLIIIHNQNLNCGKHILLEGNRGQACIFLKIQRDFQLRPCPFLAFRRDLSPISSTSCLQMASPSPVPP